MVKMSHRPSEAYTRLNTRLMVLNIHIPHSTFHLPSNTNELSSVYNLCSIIKSQSQQFYG